MFNRRCAFAILAAALVLMSVPAFSQVDTGIIEAVALDQSKAALPGVTVTVSRPETGFQTAGITDTAGLARFPALRPGSYLVSFGLEGFATVKEQKVALLVGQTAKFSVTMRPAASESITVVAEAPIVDLHKSDSSTNILPQQIESLPVADRQFERLAFIAPGVQRERGGFRFINGGPVVGAGGNASQTTVMVDGVDLTDDVNGLSRARFSQDAVREFRVIQNRFDSEIGGSAGGAMSIVTKSGTNDLRGSLFGFFRDASLRSKGALDLEKNNDYSRHQLGFTLGGPITRDKLFFFTSLEAIHENNIVLFRPGGAFASQAADVSHPFSQTLLYGGVDANFNPQMTGGAKVVYEKYTEDNFRVGGVSDPSYGQTLERKNWNTTFEHNTAISANSSNEARAQFGARRFFEPTNTRTGPAEWYSSGNTLQTGTNILGDLLGSGTMWEARDTYHHSFTTGRSSHDLKAGLSYMHDHERFRLDTYQNGLFLYLTDTKALPLAYAYGVGSSDVATSTNLIGGFVEDGWRPSTNLLVNLGVRYDLDTNGNNAGFTHPLIPTPRKRDTNNYQPRAAFTYDLKGDGTNILRGGAGIFTGRMLLVPALSELQQNGVTGRVTYTRINGALLGFPSLALDPNNPTTTGIVSKPAITLLSPTYKNPDAKQASLGYTVKLGESRMYFDTEGIYVKGENEIFIRDINWSGNATHVRPITQYDQVNMYTNDGHSQYKALVFSLNGNVRQADLLTASVTMARKKNLSDDFSPDFPTGYPNDPADPEGEWGRARGDEHFRFVASGVFHAPWKLTVAPILEYGSGQPWTQRLGYDFNGDGKNSDRAVGVGRNTMEGPKFKSISLRLTRDIPFSGFGSAQIIAEAFNLTNFKNYDVQSVQGGQYLSGPTIANPKAAFVANPSYGKYLATLSPREIQLGIRWVY
ncbi:MAG TPA: carboxypeptidase regulatory-like domain-containing protein [Thermoanaerobaculia bacterium]|nr:carboxypeptidase regulatory-like domain-containing protein [Thermoanaerobaculia bacterium]